MTAMYHQMISNAGIRPSVQRVAIYAYLCEHHTHPTVEAVYEDLSPKYPTLSRTTIYNTLKLFEEKRLVQSIQIEDDKLRYDCDTSDHVHFKCSRCGKVYDMFNGGKILLPKISDSNFLPHGFTPHKMQTNIWGVCPECSTRK